MQRFRSSDAQVSIDERRGRLCISWTATDPATFHDLKTSFRATFPTHHAVVWLPQDHCWSLRAWLQPRVEDWLWRTVEPDAVTWVAPTRGGRRSSGRYEPQDQEPPAARTPITLREPTPHCMCCPARP